MKQIIYIFLFLPVIAFGQMMLKGQVTNSGDTEGIHVFNKTYQKYTITDQYGKFEIPVNVNDTLVFSAIQYKLKSIIVTKKIVEQEALYVILEVLVNELDEVFIKPKLSGNLLSDTKNIKTRDPVTASTLKLPNANVKPPTQAERRLQTASNFSPQMGGSLGGLGGAVSLDAIINAISGRTKKLKKIVTDERKTRLEDEVVLQFEKVLVEEFNIPKSHTYQFVYYASSDSLFGEIMKTNSTLIIYDFLKNKSYSYLKLLNSHK